MTDPLDHSTRYDLMTTDQASPSEIVEWLKEPGFAAYVEGRKASMAARQASVNAPTHSATCRYAERIAIALRAKHYSDITQWSPLSGDLIGLLTQIDNLSSGLVCPTIPAAEPVGWSYEFHDFGDVWKRHAILNRPDGGANPPTAHHGSPIRNVTPLYASTAPPTAPSRSAICAALPAPSAH